MGTIRNISVGAGSVMMKRQPLSGVVVTRAKTPDWFKRAVMYQIFPDRFCRQGDRIVRKNAVIHADWEDTPFYYKDVDTKEIVAYDFFGAYLAGIREKLPYLKNLGFQLFT